MECRDGSGLLPQLGPSAAPALRFGICILIARYGSKCERTRLLASGLPPNDFDALFSPSLGRAAAVRSAALLSMPRNRACRHFRRRRCLEQPGQGLGLDTGSVHCVYRAWRKPRRGGSQSLPGLFHARDEPYA